MNNRKFRITPSSQGIAKTENECAAREHNAIAEKKNMNEIHIYSDAL